MLSQIYYWLYLGKWRPWGEEGLDTLRSLLTIKKGTGPFNFQPNELFLKFQRQQIAISNLKSDAFWENMSWEGEVSTLRSLWILEKALELLITDPMCPRQRWYDHPFYIYLICPQGITYNSYPEACGGLSSSKPNFQIFQLRWTKWLSQNFYWMCLENSWA